jgi:hypothetical protein
MKKRVTSRECNVYNINKVTTKTLIKWWNEYEMTSETHTLISKELTLRHKK